MMSGSFQKIKNAGEGDCGRSFNSEIKTGVSFRFAEILR
jgi:hypothetical protein